MTRNRFHKLMRAILALISALTLGLLSQIPAVGVVQISSVKFAGGAGSDSILLTDAGKASLMSQRSGLEIAGSVTLTGFSATGTTKAISEARNLQRTGAVATFLQRLGITAPVTQVSGGFAKLASQGCDCNTVLIETAAKSGLIWAREFNQPRGTVIDGTSFWGLHGNGTQELGLPSYGTGEIELNDPLFATTDGSGNLRIHTERISGSWRSARIWTAGKVAFQYGRLEIRAKFPDGSFNWPAIWMLGKNYAPPNRSFGTTQWPSSGELDIAEGLGANSVVQGTLHGPDRNGNGWAGGAGVTGVAPLGKISSGFHVWGIDWKPNQITFTMDGTAYATDTFDGKYVTQVLPGGDKKVFDSAGNWPFNQPFFLILNNAVLPGSNQANGTNSDFLIDYVRYSTLEGLGGTS